MAERDIIARLRLAGEQFSQELDAEFSKVPRAAERAGADAGDRFSSGFGTKLAGLTIAGASAVALVGEAVGRSFDFAKELDDTARGLRVNVERLQEWRAGAIDAGASAEELDASLGFLRDKIRDASDGNRDAQQSFVDLGVGFETVAGRGRDTDAVFRDVIDRLSRIEDPAKRAETATQLLGDEVDRLLPLAEGGAQGLDGLTASTREFGGVLSADAIKNLDASNAKIERMQTVLSIKIASTVAENADSIAYLVDRITDLSAAAVQGVADYLKFNDAVNERSTRHFAVNSRKGLTEAQRTAAKAQIDRELGFQDVNTGGFWASLGFTESSYSGPPKPLTAGVRPILNRLSEASQRAAAEAVPPVLTPRPARASSTRRSVAPRQSEDERQAAQAAKDRAREIERAWSREQDFGQALSDNSRVLEDQVRVESVRAEQGEAAAAQEEARLEFLRQHPLAVHQTVEELAVALGLTRDLTTAQKDLNAETRSKLQADIDGADFLERRVVDRAGEQTRRKEEEEAQRRTERQAEEFRRSHEQAVRDVAILYEDLFSGGVDRLWKDFKSMGLRAVAEVAAKWTLATISGQSFDPRQAFDASLSTSPIGALFGAGRTMFGSGANDNGTSAQFEAAFGSMPGFTPGFNPDAPSPTSVTGLGGGTLMSRVGSVLGPLAMASAANQLIGDVLGFKGGPLGILTGLFDDIVNPNRTAGAHLTGISDITLGGKDKKNYEAAGGLADSVVSGLQRIADVLDADLGSFDTTIGVRGGDYRVNTSGTSLKIKNGAVNYGEDAEAAVAAAIQDAINDGVLLGVSQAAQNILKSGKDLQASIEKAALIESVPQLLQQRLDPLGFALDEIDDKFRDLADALKEGGASAEQIAQARQLWQLEREDAIKQIGEASATLKGFLSNLAVGSNSPLSLRQQEAAAREALAPFEAQIAAASSVQAELARLKSGGGSAEQIKAAEEAARIAAGKIDQAGFQDAAQALLGIERSISGSSGNFFQEFDRIKNLTKDAIALVDRSTASSPGSAVDPFSELIAASTRDAANMLFDQNKLTASLLSEVQGLRQDIAKGGNNSLAWLTERRGF